MSGGGNELQGSKQASFGGVRTHAPRNTKKGIVRPVSTQSLGKENHSQVCGCCLPWVCSSYSFPPVSSPPGCGPMRVLLSYPSFYAFHLDLEMTIVTSNVDGRGKIGRPWKSIISVRSPPLFLTSSFSYPSFSLRTNPQLMDFSKAPIHPLPRKFYSDHSGHHQERKVGIPGGKKEKKSGPSCKPKLVLALAFGRDSDVAVVGRGPCSPNSPCIHPIILPLLGRKIPLQIKERKKRCEGKRNEPLARLLPSLLFSPRHKWANVPPLVPPL